MNLISVRIHASDAVIGFGLEYLLEQISEIGYVCTESSQSDISIASIDGGASNSNECVIRLALRGESIVAVVDDITEDQLLKFVAAGVRSIVWRRDLSATTLRKAILRVARGESYLPPDLTAAVMGHLGHLQRVVKGSDAHVLPSLAEREIKVLSLLSDGLQIQEVAATLAYSERTVKRILHDLFSRLNFRNRVHAVAYALRQGYL